MIMELQLWVSPVIPCSDINVLRQADRILVISSNVGH